MKFETDKIFLIYRFAILFFCVALNYFFISKLFQQKLISSEISIILKIVLVTILFSLIYRSVNSICILKNSLTFKNIFGINIKQFDRKIIRGKKIIFLNYPYKIINILSLAGNKYDSLITVKIILENGKKFTFNGHVLSVKGLKDLSTKIKK